MVLNAKGAADIVGSFLERAEWKRPPQKVAEKALTAQAGFHICRFTATGTAFWPVFVSRL
jgi:hypothetical protein